MTLWECPDDWDSAVDPDQGEDAETPAVKLQDSWDAMIELMRSDA